MTPDTFPAALAIVLKLEGGYANDPRDPGGSTMQGVTQATYDAWRAARKLAPADVRGITASELEAIYRRGFWEMVGAQCDVRGRPALALGYFDEAVNCGTHQAALHLQRALGVPDDGKVGPRTCVAIATCYEAATLTRLLDLRAAFYRALVAHRPPSAAFLPSWLARLRAVARAAGIAVPASCQRPPAEIAAQRVRAFAAVAPDVDVAAPRVSPDLAAEVYAGLYGAPLS